MVILLPIVAALSCFLWPGRSIWIGLINTFTIVLSVAGLSLQVVEQGAGRYAVGGWEAPLGIALVSDGLSLLMLMVTAVVGLAISVYSSCYFNQDKARHFWPLWMLLWAALNALFLSADIFNIYVTLELMGLAAVALVALAGGKNSLGAAMRYLLVSLLGSLFYLLGVVLLYHSFGTVDMSLLAQRLESSPAVWAAMGLMTSGLLLKTALFPLHFWLPPAHGNAPAPVSALLSALVVKASFYILLRLWLEVFPVASFEAGQLLGLLGAAAVLWGGVLALRQTRLKLLIAYSTVMQIGYLFLAFPLASIAGWKAAVYLLLSHALAKTAMFMAAGNILLYEGHDRIAELDRVAQRLPMTLGAFALAGVSLMGLPPSGGFIGKWLLLEAAIRSGQWWWGIVLIAGGLLTGAYVFKVIGFAFTQSNLPHESRAVPIGMEWAALFMAMLAIGLGFIAPWILSIMDTGSPFGVATR
ncbi:MAG: oxidoreductase [Chloroflexi bacterium]|mgnify:FL=1|nr:oxidoreductase [Gammaproteobacteria bacterium]MBT7082050.1 oxidoreductase [Chloroflexota bacterium]